MKERPILFTGLMVRAILDGSKTQTRRVVAGGTFKTGVGFAALTGPDTGDIRFDPESGEWYSERGLWHRRCPYGQSGDRLWVRETWADLEQITDGSFARQAIYRADDIEQYGDEDEFVDVTSPDMRWRPSIHMPRWASRILLEITSVRVERLQDISREDAIAEGIRAIRHEGDGTYYHHEHTHADPGNWCDADTAYQALWESINGAGSWDANPWVWVVEFRRVES